MAMDYAVNIENKILFVIHIEIIPLELVKKYYVK